jgi:hypothetical protein
MDFFDSNFFIQFYPFLDNNKCGFSIISKQSSKQFIVFDSENAVENYVHARSDKEALAPITFINRNQ